MPHLLALVIQPSVRNNEQNTGLDSNQLVNIRFGNFTIHDSQFTNIFDGGKRHWYSEKNECIFTHSFCLQILSKSQT